MGQKILGRNGLDEVEIRDNRYNQVSFKLLQFVKLSSFMNSGRPNIRIRIRIRPNPPKIRSESEFFRRLKNFPIFGENFMGIIFL